MSGNSDLGSARDDIQEVISLKIALREEIKTELRAEFKAIIDGSKGVSDARYDSVRETIETLSREMGRRFEETDKRYNQRYEAQQQSLKEQFIASEKAVLNAMASADRAVLKAEASAEKRFESVNESKATLFQQAASFLPRSEAEANFKALNEKVATLRELTSASSGKSEGFGQVITAGIAAIAVLVSLGSVIFANHTPAAPHSVSTVEANSKRLDDLIAQNNEQNRLLSSRLDALSGRINGLTPRPQP